MGKKIEEKIQKLLALAGNNQSDEEAQAALLKAQELMAEHGIQQEDLKEGEEKQDVIHFAVTEWRRPAWWEKQLANTLAHNFKSYCYISAANRQSQIKVMGLEKDVKVIKELFDFAVKYIKHRSKQVRQKIRKEYGTAKGGHTNDYISGFLKGLEEKFQQQVEEKALVLRADVDVQNEWEEMQRRMKKGKTSKIQSKGNMEAYQKGYEEGKSFSKPKREIKGRE